MNANHNFLIRLVVGVGLSLPVILLAEVGFGGSNPGEYRISDTSHAGTGCPQGSRVTAKFSSRSTLELQVPDFTARLGGRLSNKRSNCRILVTVEHPSGVEYAVSNTRFTVERELASGDTGQATFKSYFQGSTEEAEIEREIAGPASGQESVDEPVRRIWSGCARERALNLSYAVVVNGEGPSSTVTLTGPTELDLDWRECR